MHSESLHHAPATTIPEKTLPPRPSKARSGWLSGVVRFFKDDTEQRWGGRLIRIATDMMVVCDEDLKILYHNKAFLKGVGFQAGTFVGHSLIDFFPGADRPGIRETFEHLLAEKSKAARMDADFVTQRGIRTFDSRIVRSLNSNGKYFFYIVARDETESRVAMERLAKNAGSRFLDDLPLAAWRTDQELKIVDSCGSLWNALDISKSSLIGLDLSNSRCPQTPQFLHSIDYCDTMAGQTLHTSIEWDGEFLDATVEPILDSHRRVVGTLGMIRLSKNVITEHSAEHLQITQAVRTITDPVSTRKVKIGPSVTSRLSGNIDVDELGEDPIALAN